MSDMFNIFSVLTRNNSSNARNSSFLRSRMRNSNHSSVTYSWLSRLRDSNYFLSYNIHRFNSGIRCSDYSLRIYWCLVGVYGGWMNYFQWFSILKCSWFSYSFSIMCWLLRYYVRVLSAVRSLNYSLRMISCCGGNALNTSPNRNSPYFRFCLNDLSNRLCVIVWCLVDFW